MIKLCRRIFGPLWTRLVAPFAPARRLWHYHTSVYRIGQAVTILCTERILNPEDVDTPKALDRVASELAFEAAQIGPNRAAVRKSLQHRAAHRAAEEMVRRAVVKAAMAQKAAPNN